MKLSHPVRSAGRLTRSGAVLATAALLFSGCQHLHLHRPPPPPPPLPPNFATVAPESTLAVDPALLQRPNFEYRLGPGDQLDLEVVGDPDTRSRTVVGPDGKIYFYLLPGIDVWGLTIPQARDRIAQELQKYVREKQAVSITLRAAESERVWILGRLNKPGVYPMPAPMTLLEALSEAGGPAPAAAFASLAGPVGVSGGRGSTDEAADLGRAFVIRQGKLLRIDFARLLRDGDLSQNIYLQPDDFVYLPSASIGSVHVLGAVNAARSIDYTSRLTLAQALAQAGGTLAKDAYLSHVAIVRGSLTQPRVAVVDFHAIVSGQAPDVALEPQDIVYVPHTPYRVLTRYVDLILDTFARTVGVNEGARVVTGNAQPLGVSVPLGP
jgi:polysaccharide biosynthesis/export protein